MFYCGKVSIIAIECVWGVVSERVWFHVIRTNCIQVIKTTPITKMRKGGANVQ